MVDNDLSGPERLVWNAFPRGTWVDLRVHDSAADDLQSAGSWDSSRTIRAEVVAALLLGAGADEPGRAPAIRLRGARISGRLDLMGATLRSPLVLEGCYFDDEPRFVESTARTVWIAASRLPGFNGTRMRLDGILNLRASTVSSAIRLDQAQIAGQLCLRDVAAGADINEVVIAADRLNVDDRDPARIAGQRAVIQSFSRGRLHGGPSYCPAGQSARPYIYASPRLVANVLICRVECARRKHRARSLRLALPGVGAHLPTLDQTICAPLRIQLTQLPATNFGREHAALCG